MSRAAALAEMIGEPEPAVLVEYQIVRPLQRMLAAFVEQVSTLPVARSTR